MDGHIRTGWRRGWNDYDRGSLTRWQITLPEADAQHLSSEVAVALSLVIPCFYIVVRRVALAALPVIYNAISSIYNWVARRSGRPRTQSNFLQHHGSAVELGPPDQHGAVLTFVETLGSTGDEDNPFKALRKLLTGIPTVRESEDSISTEIKTVLTKDIPSATNRLWKEPKLTGAIISVATLVLALCILGIWAGIESSDILTDNVALSRYGKDPEWYVDYQGPLQESVAGKYRDECYNISIGESYLSSSSITCNQFYHSTIPYTAAENTSCPFDGEVCVPGADTALTLSTGWLDTNVLGINTAKSNHMKFEKTTTCSPVSNEEPWVVLNAWGNWEYYYHDCDDGLGYERTTTYINAGDWSRYLSPLHGYSAEAIRLAPTFQPGWLTWPCVVPRTEFKAGSSAVSLIFVVPLGRMTFANYRDDPVFPAKEDAFPIPGLGYKSTTTRAGVLGCVDSFKVCNSLSSRCWDQGNWTQAVDSLANCSQTHSMEDPRCEDSSTSELSSEEKSTMFLLDRAFRDTDAAGAIRNRGGFGLDAAKMLGREDFIFSLLAAEQWKVEAENFFQTSLARMQINIYDFVRRTYVFDSAPEDEMAINIPEYAVNTYKMYKFRTEGYKNVSGFWFVGINTFCVVLFVWSRRYSTPMQREANINKGGNGGYHDNLWGTIVLKKCGELLFGCLQAILSGCSWIWGKVVASRRKRKNVATTNGQTPATA